MARRPGESAGPWQGPNRDAALAQYRRRAAVYDLELALFEPIRRQAVARLALQRGELVFDLGCGTGLSLPLLRAADAALFHFTHDVLRRPEAVAHVLRHLRPGARVVASGLRWAPAWLPLVNLLVLPAALQSVSSLEGLRQPWSHLARHLGPVKSESLLLCGVHLAGGAVPGEPP